MPSRIRYYGPAIVLILATLLVMYFGPPIAGRITYAQTKAQLTLVRDSLSSNATLEDLSNSFRKVAQVVEPSVVHIQVAARDKHGSGARRFIPDEFQRWFRSPHPLEREWWQRREGGENESTDEYEKYDKPRLLGNGSGWVYDDTGHIVTNNHVIENADKIQVLFADGTEREATVVGTDPKTDIAVIRVEGEDFHPLERALEPVEQGNIVFAFGSPLGFRFSMSQGIVSATGRSNVHIIRGGAGYEEFIQTDAAINRGNSGGPLTNVHGRIVGMNTAIATRTGGSDGLGFAIPVNMITDVVKDLIGEGTVRRGYMGIIIIDLTKEQAKTFGVDQKAVLIEDLLEDGPSGDAGLLRGDVIVRINDTQITSVDQLRKMVAAFSPGVSIKVGAVRKRELQTVDVKLVELSEQVASARVSRPRLEPGDGEERDIVLLLKLGIERFSTWTEQMAQRVGVPHTPGVLVARVRSGSIAQNAGIKRGTIITHVMNVPVKQADALIEQINQHADNEMIQMDVLEPIRSGEFRRMFKFLEVPRE